MLDKKLIVTPRNEVINSVGENILISPKQFTIPNNSIETYQPLVMFVGGAMDSSSKALLNGVFNTYNKLNETRQDIGYGTYRAVRTITELALHWRLKGQKVVLVGHSYGGDAAMDVTRVLSNRGETIDLVVTLDPVSRTGPTFSQVKPTGLKRWLNVYVPYKYYRSVNDDFLNTETGHSLLYKTKLANSIAMIGGAWGRCLYADYNKQFFDKSGNEHARTENMFQFFEPYVKDII